MSLLLSLVVTHAHAGIWQRACDALIKSDPYQYESWPTEYLERSIKRLEIREAWNRLDPNGREQLEQMRATLQHRRPQ